MRATHHKGKTTSVRLDTDLNISIHEWLDQNPDFNLSRLVNIAVRKFITTKQTLQAVETVQASKKEVQVALKKMMKKHAHMLEKLK